MKLSRKAFLKSAAVSPLLFNIGCAGFGESRRAQIRKGSKIRVALIGCGAEARTIIPALLAENLVAVVDPDPAMFDLMEKEVAKLSENARLNFMAARRFSDYRVMFDRMDGRIDAVVIETPNHHHALPALMALRRDIHVYLDKPMTLTVEEAEIVGRESAARPDVVTQVGTFGHSFYTMPYCVARVKEGVLGDVTDVWCYADRINAMMFRPKSAPPPAGMDWDVWCGGSPVCDYYPATEDYNGIHPHDWHSWIGYGNGSIGNMGTHIIDFAYWALDLGKTSPTRIDTIEAQFACPGAWSWRNVIDYHFPARDNIAPVTLHWWDGPQNGIPYTKEFVNKMGQLHKREHQNLPPIVLETEKKWGIRFHNHGLLMVGTKGALFYTHHGGFRFLPDSLGGFRDRDTKFDYRKMTLPHVGEFFQAIRDGREANNSFAYSVPLAKIVLLGNVAARAGKGTLFWDGHRITNNEKANEYLRTTYRPGWEVG